jgi:hypothetical protein
MKFHIIDHKRSFCEYGLGSPPPSYLWQLVPEPEDDIPSLLLRSSKENIFFGV